MTSRGQEFNQRRIRARWVFPVEGPPLENACVVIRGDTIVGVEPAVGAAHEDLGDVAIIPGLVNAHTHLEFSSLAEPLGPFQPFTAWLRSVIAWRRRTVDDRAAALRAGLEESLTAGVTLLGEIATPGWTAQPWHSSPAPETVAFFETLGLAPERVEPQAAATSEFVSARASEGPMLRAGVSPHAPYSVHPDLVRRLAAISNERNVPLAMHLAETEAELQLLANGSGEFVDFLKEMGVWRPEVFATSSRPLDSLRMLAAASRSLVIHGNDLAGDELDFLATQPRVSVVYCPRTHAAFSHSPHPWREMQTRGIRVSLGTDSRASNPDLNPWREVQFLAERHPDVSGETLLRMATLNGAEALGLADRHGSLSPGKLANLAVVEIPAGDGRTPLHRRLVSPGTLIRRVLHRGRWL